MITNPGHTLIFGNITMVEDGANPPDATGVRYNVMSQDTTFGNPVPVTKALLSLMRAGSLVTYDHTENREPTLRVTIMAEDSNLLAQGEKALQLECEKSNTLTWIPPDGAGEPSVFDVVWSSLELVYDDVQDLLQQRVYLVHIQALPHAHPVDLVTTVAVSTPGVPAAETSLFDGTSASGWYTNGVGSPPPTVVAGALQSATTEALYYVAEIGRIAQDVDLSAGGYVSFKWQVSAPVQASRSAGMYLWIAWDGNIVEAPVVMTSVAAPWTTYWVKIPDGVNTAKLRFLTWILPGYTGFQTIDQISRWNRLPDSGTARQKTTSLVPGGSVSTQGSIQVAHPTSSLGKTIVYTHPSGTGYLPPLRPWLLSSAGVTTDAALVSGARNAIGTTTTIYQIPVVNLPEGRTEVWAWLRETSAVITRQVDWAIASFMGSTLLDYDLRATQVAFLAINGWQLVCLGAAMMPPVQLGAAGRIQVHLHTGVSTVEVDEAYIFATDRGRLTIVDCATGAPAAGGPSNRLWVDAPSQVRPSGAVYRGNAADRSDAWHAGSVAVVWQIHDFAPEGTAIFVATPNATDAVTSLEHYKRFHTHVARDL